MTYGSTTVCTATVTRGGSSYNVTGTVAWTTADAGTFATSPCTLSGAGATASCQVTYTPTAVGDGAHGVTATYGGDTNYNGSNNTQSVTVNKATPTASITNSPVVYNGSPQTAVVACSGGGAATLVSGGTGTNAGSYPATVDCAASANYAAMAGLNAGSFVINPAPQTASITNSPVTYNGSPQTAVVACSGGGAATLVSGGTGTNVGSYPATVDCAANGNYAATAGLNAGSFVIDPAPQTASITNSPVTFNGSPQTAVVACSGGGAATLVSGGTGTNVGSYPATVDCAANGNYAATAGLNAGSFVIDPAPQTASITNSPVTFNGSPQTAVVACSGGGAATLVSGGTGTNVGSYPATVDCAANGNYAATAGLNAGSFVIDPAPQTASITNSPVTFNGSPQTAVVACSGGGAATLVSGGTGTNVGSYPATVDCAANGNYAATAGLNAGSFVIDPAPQTASITNSPVTFNGSPQTAAVACSGGGAATLVSGGTGTNVGSYPATVDCAANGNYAATAGLNAGSFVIDPAPQTASITNSPVTFNGSPQTAVVACSGGGAATLVSGGTGTNVGSYPATVDCAANGNYAATAGLNAGSFVIDPAPQTASITNSPVTFNGSPQTAVVACSGGGAATLVSGGTGTNVGSYPATVDCAANGNYAATAGLNAGSFVIDPAPQTASITNSPVTFNGSPQTAVVACSAAAQPRW